MLPLLFSCGNKCKEDSVFKEKFFQNLSIVEEYSNIAALIQQDKPYSLDEAFVEKLSYADKFNYGVTGISLGEEAYTNVDSVISLWKDWYEQNKCYMTMQKADSLYFYNWVAYDAAVNLFFVKRINVGLGNDEEYFDFLLDSIRKVGRERFFAQRFFDYIDDLSNEPQN